MVRPAPATVRGRLRTGGGGAGRPAARWWVRAAGRSRPRSDPADEHAGRGGQARAPLNVDGGESSPKVAEVQLGPELLQLFECKGFPHEVDRRASLPAVPPHN